MSKVLELEDVWRQYGNGTQRVVALRGVTSSVDCSAVMVAVVGPIGSGKTTVLNAIGALDRPTRGRVLLNGQDLAALNQRELSAVRCRSVGFVFQTFNLIPNLTAFENVGLPMEFACKRGRAAIGCIAHPGAA